MSRGAHSGPVFRRSQVAHLRSGDSVHEGAGVHTTITEGRSGVGRGTRGTTERAPLT